MSHHTLQCPDCTRKLRFKRRDGDPDGARIRVLCPCGTSLRTRLPQKPKAPEVDVFEFFDQLGERLGQRWKGAA